MDNNSQVKNKSRLVYVEPNEYAGLEAKRNNPNLENSTMLSWNPEELAMSVDLQVIIPRREDAGQVSYRIDINGNSINFSDDSLRGRFVSYIGGTSFENTDQSFLTDNYTNISYQEIANAQTIDKESLGINNIDISFDSHFFPMVTMRFTDVRGSSLFMPGEEEFVESLKKQSIRNRQDVKNTANSFFRALFHFPYPRFLLSVKGFYGTRVTFQLAVSDFRSNLVPETGNFDITVQFIGYVYGLYTDLPFNLVMAAPYYNHEYWEYKKNDGTFRYVTNDGKAGNEISTYVEFLSKMESKTVDEDALVGAEKTKSYLKTKEAIKALKEIPDLYRKACESAPVKENGNKTYWTKRYSSIQTFIWGLMTAKKNDAEYITKENGGFHFDESITLDLYKAIQKIYNEFPEYKRLVQDNNIFLQSWENKKINGNKVTDDMLANDKEFKYKALFSYVQGVSGINTIQKLENYFTFHKEGDPIDGDTGNTYQSNFYIKEQKDLFKNRIGDDKTFKEDCIIFKPGSCLVTVDEGLSAILSYTPANTYGLLIKVEEYCRQINNKIKELETQLQSQEREITEELKGVYENVIGFQPTVENYYRMLFAHIDCFMNYYNQKILRKVKDDLNKNKRTLNALGITAKETDVPKKFAWDPNCDVFPFPAYYTKTSDRQNAKKIADYPGYAKDKEFSKIPEVTAVDDILNGIKELKFEYESLIKSQSSTVAAENIFSPLSVLYDFKNPWSTLKLSGTDNHKDIIHIIYFYMSLLYADKVIGTNTDRSNVKDAIPYKQQLANLLLEKIGRVKENVFIETLAQEINKINESNGLERLCKETSKVYHLNEFKTDNTSYIKIVNEKKDTQCQSEKTNKGLVVLKIDDNKLTIPAKDLDENEYFVTGGCNNETEHKIQAFTGDSFLSKYDNTKLKSFNDSLIKLGEGQEYLSDKDEKIVLGDYCANLLLDKPYGTDEKDVKPLVGFNKEDAIVFKYHKEENTQYIDGEDTEFVKSVIDTKVDLVKTDDTTYTHLLQFYNENTKNKHINFIGRKTSGLKGNIDSYTSVNLFSGIRKYTIGGNNIITYVESSDPNDHLNYPPTWKLSEEGIQSISGLKLNYYKGLMLDNRCTPWTDTQGKQKAYTVLSDEEQEQARYAFATYFLATLCGCDEHLLSRIVKRFGHFYIDRIRYSYVLRKVELLYLGGLLYFAKNNLNGSTDNEKIIRGLINTDGTLGYGLIKADGGKIDPKLETVYVNGLFNNSNEPISDRLINYFSNWCDNELFGGKNMYNLLSQVSEEDNDEYLTLNGYAAYNNGIENTERYSLVQGYKTGGECEKWLTELAYAYEHAISFETYYDKTDRTYIYKKEIIDFLTYVHDSLKSEKEKREQGLKDFEDGKTVTLTEDTRRATYYLLKNLYDKWLCTYTAKEFELHKPEIDLNIRKERYSLSKSTGDSYSEYNNFIFIDQFYRDISSSYIMDSDLMAQTIKDIYHGRSNIDTYTLMSFMAEKNNLMLLALPVYTNMYNAQNVEQVFRPNTLYNMNSADNCNGVGTTYVVMYTDEVSHKPGDFGDYDYDADYIDVADTVNNHGPVDLELFSVTNNKNDSDLDYNVTAFGVTYGKQNQMYFKKVNVSMDNPKVTNESIKNLFILADGGSQGDTNQPIAIGQNIYSIYANRSYTCTVEMMGCMNIMPMMYFQLNNSPVFRGLYMIINVKHSIKPGDITTTFTGVRVNKYALPDVTDVMLNSSIFDKLRNSNAWKDGKALSGCGKDECQEKVPDEQLSEHFTLYQLINSSNDKDTCKDKNKTLNNPNTTEKENLRELCINLLEPLYKAYAAVGGTFKINSGFRSACVNAMAGGVDDSDHRKGYAADLQATNAIQVDFIKFVKCWLWNNKIEFKQFIDEKDGNSRWVHISYQKGGNRKEFLTYDSDRSKPKYWKISEETLNNLCS